MHSADFVSSRGEIYVFRGGNGREYLNDLHALDTHTYEWRRVETRGAIPQQRANHSSAVLEETSELFIFGGWNGKERLNDIHVLDTMTGTWTKPDVGGDKPYPRAGMTLTALRGRLYLFGGSGTSSKCFQDLQILDRKQMAWLNVMQAKDPTNSASSSSHSSSPASSSQHYYGSTDQQQTSGDDEMDTRGPIDGEVGSSTHGASVVDSDHLKRSDWRHNHHAPSTSGYGAASAANPNDEDVVPTVFVQGRGPGRRAGHTATAVHRRIFVFGGSCGSDYLNDFFVLDTDPVPAVSASRPASLQLFERRLRHFCNDEEFSDVTFLVEGRRVRGHRLVLSLVSDCFRAMFATYNVDGAGGGERTGFRESSSDSEIEIPNCSYEAFVTMLEYIYSGRAPEIGLMPSDAGSVVVGGGAGEGGRGIERRIERVVDVLELADQFFLEHLKQLCEQALCPTVNAETFEYLLQVAQKTNAMQLEGVCRHFQRNRDDMGNFVA
mmetsp:Transcript_2484/g.6503  ORF Transcript_2484/g.6503 Transcript_2484/m.6503 type:complete len:493 (-) Transcript_2484:273-1751(-)